MVTTKSRKEIKYSYAERVLGAVSQVQKDHRKHAVHIATLRAQVRRNAQAKKDKLGPKWARWVGKAVHKLETEGILQALGPGTGSVTLTPTGKKAIAMARKSLKIHTNTTPSHKEEDLIYKHVTQHGSVRGVKRARGLKNADENDSDIDETPSKPARKRGRPLTSVLHRPEFTTPQPGPAFTRPFSPLTDLSDDEDDEIARLKLQLKERDEELKNMKRELSKAKLLTSREGDGSASVPQTSLDYVPSSPLLTMISHKSNREVVRTQSGSLIPQLSKRPTPAPTSPDEDADYREVEDDIFRPTDASLGSRLTSGFDEQLAQPQTEDPDSQEDSRIAELMGDLTNLKRVVDELSSSVKTKNLEIAERDTSLSALQNENIKIAGELASLKIDIEYTGAESASRMSDANAKIADLGSQLNTARTAYQVQLSEHEDLRLLQHELEEDKNSRIQELEHLNDKISMLRDENENLNAALTLAKAEHVDREEYLSKTIQEKTHVISELEAAIQSLSVNLGKTQEAIATSEWDLQKALDDLKQAEEQQQRFASELTAKEEELSHTKDCFASAESRVDELTTRIVTNEEISRRLSEQLQGAEGRITLAQESLLGAQNSHELERINLQTSLAAAQTSAQDLRLEVTAVENARERIQTELEKTSALLETTQKSLADAIHQASVLEVDLAAEVNTVARLEESLLVLRHAKMGDEKVIEELKSSYRKFRDQQVKFWAEMDDQMSTDG